jgi:hypothetical protein
VQVSVIRAGRGVKLELVPVELVTS